MNADKGTESSVSTAETMDDVNNDSWTVDDKLRNVLTNILVNNGKLRKQVNSVIRYALKEKLSSPPRECEDSPIETVESKNLDR